MAGQWIVEVRDDVGEWQPTQGDYSDLPSPADGGTAEQVIAAERASAGCYPEGAEIRAMWVDDREEV